MSGRAWAVVLCLFVSSWGAGLTVVHNQSMSDSESFLYNMSQNWDGRDRLSMLEDRVAELLSQRKGLTDTQRIWLRAVANRHGNQHPFKAPS